MKKYLNFQHLFLWMVLLGTAAFSVSCDSDDLYDPSFENIDNELQLSISEESVALSEEDKSRELEFIWSTGTNYGTNQGIFYTLEIDLEENDFSFPLEYELGKETYDFSLRYGVLNDILQNTYGVEAGDSVDLTARITASVGGEEDMDQVDVVNFTATTYQPLTEELYLIGSASPNGWDANNPIEMTRQGDEAVFEYTGSLNEGEFKFITTLGEFLPSYNMGEDENSLFYRTSDDEPDDSFEITEAGVYNIEANLLDGTISVTTVDDPPFSKLYIVGDGTESGWTVDDPAEFEQNEEDPFIFEYEGTLSPGDMKIFAGPMGDWCGQWYRPLEAGQDITNTDVEQNSGCDVDNTWRITEETEGRYKITVNTRDESVEIEQVNLYIVGDGGPNGWDINNPEPMERSGSVYTYTGPLGEENATGEFKIAKFKGDWCDGEWINPTSNGQSISNTEFIYTQGCDGPDNKWKLREGEAGDYIITVDLDAETISIEAQ